MTTPPLKTILIAEDDPDIQEIAVMALEDFGEYTVEACDNGRQAVDRAPIVVPDLILLDVMMPEMDGPTALDTLRADPRTRDIPVIFLTAKSQPHEIAEYLEKGAIAVIRKPFDPVELCQEIEAAWSRHHG